MTCVCGHAREQHMHYRPGRECSACRCPGYRRPLLAPPRPELPPALDRVRFAAVLLFEWLTGQRRRP